MATISIIYGSVRSDRQGIKAARFFENTLKEGGHRVNMIDPSVYQFPLLEKCTRNMMQERLRNL